MLTRFEREKTTLSPGKNITLFKTKFGLFAVAICFDAQFPVIIRKMAEAGCRLLIVPSCTENQMAVVQSTTVGDAAWQPIADTNHGAAGAFAPSDYGFPDDGVIISGALDQPAWVYADIDFAKYDNLRVNGHVLNWKCWDEQKTVSTLPVTATMIG